MIRCEVLCLWYGVILNFRLELFVSQDVEFLHGVDQAVLVGVEHLENEICLLLGHLQSAHLQCS